MAKEQAPLFWSRRLPAFLPKDLAEQALAEARRRWASRIDVRFAVIHISLDSDAGDAGFTLLPAKTLAESEALMDLGARGVSQRHPVVYTVNLATGMVMSAAEWRGSD